MKRKARLCLKKAKKVRTPDPILTLDLMMEICLLVPWASTGLVLTSKLVLKHFTTRYNLTTFVDHLQDKQRGHVAYGYLPPWLFKALPRSWMLELGESPFDYNLDLAQQYDHKLKDSLPDRNRFLLYGSRLTMSVYFREITGYLPEHGTYTFSYANHKVCEYTRHYRKVSSIRVDSFGDNFQPAPFLRHWCLEGKRLSVEVQGIAYPEEEHFQSPLALYTQRERVIISYGFGYKERRDPELVHLHWDDRWKAHCWYYLLEHYFGDYNKGHMHLPGEDPASFTACFKCTRTLTTTASLAMSGITEAEFRAYVQRNVKQSQEVADYWYGPLHRARRNVTTRAINYTPAQEEEEVYLASVDPLVNMLLLELYEALTKWCYKAYWCHVSLPNLTLRFVEGNGYLHQEQFKDYPVLVERAIHMAYRCRMK